MENFLLAQHLLKLHGNLQINGDKMFALFSRKLLPFAMAAAVVGFSGGAQAAAVVTTATAGINDSGNGVGTHYHLSPGDGIGVDRYSTEVGHGVAEFDLTGISGGTATLSFRVSGFNDIYTSGTPYVDPISIFAYLGDNAINLSDFNATTIGLFGNFATVGLSIGDVLSFDVSGALAAALAGGTGSLGFLFEGTNAESPVFSAIRFDTVTLTAEPGQPNGVPEPSSLALLGLGLAGIAALRKRK